MLCSRLSRRKFSCWTLLESYSPHVYGRLLLGSRSHRSHCLVSIKFPFVKICGSNLSLAFDFLLLTAAVTPTNGNAPSPAIMFEVVQSHPLVFALHAKPVRSNFHIFGIQFYWLYRSCSGQLHFSLTLQITFVFPFCVSSLAFN